MRSPSEVLEFWLDETPPEMWYKQDDALDAQIRDRFGDLWEEAAEGACGLWLTSAKGALAYVILTDQFPRNMFRGSDKAFSTDRNARAAAKVAIGRDWDLQITEPARQFLYVPLMHSETLADQDRCIRLMCTRMPETGADNLLHAKVHREIIRRFGRFPYRNEALNRESTEAERAFLSGGGYGEILNELKAAAEAA